MTFPPGYHTYSGEELNAMILQTVNQAIEAALGPVVHQAVMAAMGEERSERNARRFAVLSGKTP